MTGYAFDWHGLGLEARCSGALWWPYGRWLIVADLHLGKSERMARRGGTLLPPYENLATLERLRGEVQALAPAVMVSLGDSFDDDAAARALPAPVRDGLMDLARGRAWHWIAGNHDRAGGPTEARIGGVTLRHEAGRGPDISGHFHPVVRLAGRQTRAFLIGADHLILPAFGAYTGGLDASEPVLRDLVGPGLAVACAHRALPMPIREAC